MRNSAPAAPQASATWKGGGLLLHASTPTPSAGAQANTSPSRRASDSSGAPAGLDNVLTLPEAPSSATSVRMADRRADRRGAGDVHVAGNGRRRRIPLGTGLQARSNVSSRSSNDFVELPVLAPASSCSAKRSSCPRMTLHAAWRVRRNGRDHDAGGEGLPTTTAWYARAMRGAGGQPKPRGRCRRSSRQVASMSIEPGRAKAAALIAMIGVGRGASRARMVRVRRGRSLHPSDGVARATGRPVLERRHDGISNRGHVYCGSRQPTSSTWAAAAAEDAEVFAARWAAQRAAGVDDHPGEHAKRGGGVRRPCSAAAVDVGLATGTRRRLQGCWRWRGLTTPS